MTSHEPVARNTKVKGKKEPPELAKRLAEKQTGENPTMSIILTAASVFPASPTARCHVNKIKKRKKKSHSQVNGTNRGQDCGGANR